MIIFHTKQFLTNRIAPNFVIGFGSNHTWGMTKGWSMQKVFVRNLTMSFSFSEIALLIKIYHRTTHDGIFRMVIKEVDFLLKSCRQ